MEAADLGKIINLEAMGLHLASFLCLVNLPLTVLDAQGEEVSLPGLQAPPCLYCSLMQSCAQGSERCRRFRRQAGEQAAQLGECYIARCPAGFIEIVAPIMYRDVYLGLVSCGPVMMWDWDEVALREIMSLTEDIPVSREALLVASQKVAVYDSKKVNAIADLLFMTVSHIAAEGLITLKSRKELTTQQSQIAQRIFDRKQNEDRLKALEPEGDTLFYPLQKEYELVGKVRMGDRTGAKAILNDLLGDIFFNNAGDMELLKARVVELVVVVSRAAVESGASLDKMLTLNNQVVTQIHGLKDFEELCRGVVNVLDAMMDTLYDVRNIRNARTMTLVMAYIRDHYGENLTLDAVAGHVYLSPYYISHLFKEELGLTFVEYLTRVRIEQARHLLRTTGLSIRAIASQVGYDDPGYFAKVFRKHLHISPKKYRDGGRAKQDSPI